MQQYLSTYHNLQSVYQNRFLLTKKFAHSKVLTLPETDLQIWFQIFITKLGQNFGILTDSWKSLMNMMGKVFKQTSSLVCLH